MTGEEARERAVALARNYVDVTTMKIVFVERRWIEIAVEGGKSRGPLRDVVGWRARFESADPEDERPDRIDVVFEDDTGRLIVTQ